MIVNLVYLKYKCVENYASVTYIISPNAVIQSCIFILLVIPSSL